MRKDEDLKMMILSNKSRALKIDMRNIDDKLFDLYLETKDILTKEQVVRKNQLILWLKKLRTDMDEVIELAERVDIEEADHE